MSSSQISQQTTNFHPVDEHGREERIVLRRTSLGAWKFALPPYIAQMMVEAGVVPTLSALEHCLEVIFYLFVRWYHLDQDNAVRFDDHFDDIYRRLGRKVNQFNVNKMHERARIIELLWLTCTDTEVHIQGTRHRGRIVAWYDPPYAQQLPVTIRFESRSHRGVPWKLTMTEVDGDGWPACAANGRITFSIAVPDVATSHNWTS